MRLFRYAIVPAAIAAVAWFAWTVRAAGERHERELAARIDALENATPPAAASPQVLTRVEVVRAQPNEDSEPVPAKQRAAEESPDERGPSSETHGPTAAQLAVTYAQQFADEPVDVGWAREAQGSFLPVIRERLPAASRVEGFQCKSRFCDLTVVHDDVATSNAFLMGLFGIQGTLRTTAGGFRASKPTTTSDGKLSYHVYVARPGVPLGVSQLENPSVEE